MKKYTKDIQRLLSTVLIGTAGIGLLTSCGQQEDHIAGDVQIVDDMMGTSSIVTEVYEEPDDTAVSDHEAEDDTSVIETEETK